MQARSLLLVPADSCGHAPPGHKRRWGWGCCACLLGGTRCRPAHLRRSPHKECTGDASAGETLSPAHSMQPQADQQRREAQLATLNEPAQLVSGPCLFENATNGSSHAAAASAQSKDSGGTQRASSQDEAPVAHDKARSLTCGNSKLEDECFVDIGAAPDQPLPHLARDPQLSGQAHGADVQQAGETGLHMQDAATAGAAEATDTCSHTAGSPVPSRACAAAPVKHTALGVRMMPLMASNRSLFAWSWHGWLAALLAICAP